MGSRYRVNREKVSGCTSISWRDWKDTKIYHKIILLSTYVPGARLNDLHVLLIIQPHENPWNLVQLVSPILKVMKLRLRSVIQPKITLLECNRARHHRKDKRDIIAVLSKTGTVEYPYG